MDHLGIQEFFFLGCCNGRDERRALVPTVGLYRCIAMDALDGYYRPPYPPQTRGELFP
jgi:hypothetical protein